jgi:hypothetical protein
MFICRSEKAKVVLERPSMRRFRKCQLSRESDSAYTVRHSKYLAEEIPALAVAFGALG